MRVGFSIYSMFSVALVGSSLAMFSTGLLSLIFNSSVVVEWEIWGCRSTLVSASLVFDWMSLIFLSSVCLIAGCIMKYCLYYMEGEPNFRRFGYILLLFVVSMWCLIISPNQVSLLLGWDGLGLSSYALVIFYQSESACNAGMLTVLSNRVGDVAILLSIATMFSSGSFDFYLGLDKVEKWTVLLVILASASKSAQVPFSAWLPAAMAAPTPVSALVHSSTLVTAGVYLLIRYSSALGDSGHSVVLMFGGGLTMIMSSFSALFESDMKKVVALSTLSQLSLMIISLSLGLKELAFFHLITHAMFKSTLFMSVGVMIHSVGGSQDSRVMSGFCLSSPALSAVLGGSNLALCGFPFMAGFYSKDLLLEALVSGGLNFTSGVMVISGTGLTVGYSLRLVYLGASSVTSLGSTSGVQDTGETVVKSVSALFFMSVLSGFLAHWVMMPVVLPAVLSISGKALVPLVSVLGGVIAYSLIQKSVVVHSGVLKLGEGLTLSGWFLPFMSTKFLSTLFFSAGFFSMKLVEMGWSEYYGGQGGRSKFTMVSALAQKSQKSSGVSGYMISTLVFSSALILSIWAFSYFSVAISPNTMKMGF